MKKSYRSRIVPYRSRIFISFWLPLVVQSQSYSIAEIQTCPDGNYFNGATLSCSACPTGAISSDGDNHCVCPPRFRKVYSISGESETWECSECQEATTLDKFQCWSNGDCPAGVDANTGFCQCADGERLVERNSDGSKLNQPICESCDVSTTLQANDQSCAICPRDWPILTSTAESDTCQCQNNLENVCFNSALTIESTILKTVQRAGAQRQSNFIAENLFESYKRCKEERHAISCNQLANICILQFAVNTACELLQMSNTGGDIDDRLGWPQDLPWIGPLRQTDFDVITTDETLQTDFGFSDSLPIVAAKYDLQGQFHGYIPVINGLLQLCKYPEPAMNAAWYYSAPYSSSCDVSASNLINEETIFYELFLKHGSDQLFPIMVDASCDDSCPFSLVQSTPGAANFQYTRRFYMYDTITGKETADQGTPDIIRVASKIKITIRNKPSGGIYPPSLQLTYRDVSPLDSVPIQFQISYENSSDNSEAWRITMAVIIPIFVLVGLIPFISWNRRNLSAVLDLSMFIKFFLCVMDGVANSFFLVIGGFSFYWFIFSQSNEVAGISLPDQADEELFKILLTIAFIFKLISIIQMIVSQTSVDLFFIDWEREKPIAEGDQAINAPKPGKISIWRTIFAANEWSEIQVVRKTSVEFQLFATIFLLEVVGFEKFTCTTPSNSAAFTYNCNDENKREDSLYLRCGLALIVYVGIAFGQYLVNRLIISHFFFNPINNFIDLLSVMNISIFTLSQRGFGYYVHGRSVHGRSDTDMLDLQQCLKREENAQTGARGLEPGEDLQTFEVQITHRFRNEFDKCYAHLRSLQANPAVGNGGALSEQAGKQKINAYKRINLFLQKFLLHGNADIKYQIASKGFLEQTLDMEFRQVIQDTDPCVLYRDKSCESIASILFYGNELSLVIFEILCFLTFDLAFSGSFVGSYFISAAITFIIYRSLSLIRRSLGQRNLSQKTLIDDRFLI